MILQPEEILKIASTAYALWLVYFYSSTVKVTEVTDGDGFCFEVGLFRKTKQRARLRRIDAPELNQEYGDKALKSLARVILGQRVWIKKVDQSYDRIVVSVTDFWMRDICAHQVFWGHAWNYEEYGGKYYFHQWFARGGWCWGLVKQGLWKEKNPTPPWEWRKKNK